jgi:hypothetical protein
MERNGELKFDADNENDETELLIERALIFVVSIVIALAILFPTCYSNAKRKKD